VSAPQTCLIVDDSVVVRAILTDWVSAKSGFEVTGSARDGEAAIRKARDLKPDFILLDIEMPVMTGLEAIPHLREAAPEAHIIVVSSMDPSSARSALRGLHAGATDFIAKPSSDPQGRGKDAFREELVAKLKSLAGHDSAPGAPAPVPGPRAPGRTGAAPRAVLIGSSTGGPPALVRVLKDLAPAAGGAPILITQHMPAVFTEILATDLSRQTGLDIREGVDGEPVLTGRGYIAPGGYHMTVGGDADAPRIRLDQEPPINFCRPAVDPLFQSAARVYGGALIAAVLTGMGQDGARGAQAIASAGGRVIAQDEETSVVWGMPGAVSRAVPAADILPVDRIGAALAAGLTRRAA